MLVTPHIDVGLPRPAVCVTRGVSTDKLKPQHLLSVFLGRTCIYHVLQYRGLLLDETASVPEGN